MNSWVEGHHRNKGCEEEIMFSFINQIKQKGKWTQGVNNVHKAQTQEEEEGKTWMKQQ